MNHIAVFMGTRPEAIKMAPVVAALAGCNDLRPVVVSTGQHRELLDAVIDLFGFRVDHELRVMEPAQTLAGLTARLVLAIDGLLERTAVDLALVQGDTTTVFVAALVCFYRGIPVGHVEAGLRTGDLRAPYPEEANRRLAGTLADMHFAPTDLARRNLLREGVAEERVFVTGNTVIDALNMELARQRDEGMDRSIHRRLAAELGDDWCDVPYVLITGHRRENFGDGFGHICLALRTLAERFRDHRFIYPVHLNPNVQGPVRRLLGDIENVRLIEPQGYREFVRLMRDCRLVLTDSGGVQEEAPSLGKPVLVMRDVTERPEGVAAGTVLCTSADAARIVEHVSRLLTRPDEYQRMSAAVNPYGDGQAAPRIVEHIRRFLSQSS